LKVYLEDFFENYEIQNAIQFRVIRKSEKDFGFTYIYVQHKYLFYVRIYRSIIFSSILDSRLELNLKKNIFTQTDEGLREGK